MTIRINMLDEGAGIEFVCSGVVTGAEIIEANNRIYTAGNLKRLHYKLVDRTDCTDYRVTPEEIRAIAAQEKTAAFVNRNIIIALVASNDLQYGFSRMWQAHVEASGFLTGVFRDRRSALQWIEEQRGRKKEHAGSEER